MQTPIAQTIAFTTFGNAFLSGESDFGTASFYPSNSTFVFCEYVRFVDLHRQASGFKETPYAADPVLWLERLRQDNVYAIRMMHLPKEKQRLGESDRMSAGFVGGGGRWIIETIKLNDADSWEARWEGGDQSRADNKVWRVTYGRIATCQPLSNPESLELEELKSKLLHNLTEIAGFARSHELDLFAKSFETALLLLTSQDPLGSVYHKDIAPSRFLPLSAAQLLGTAQAAWVFGGMGSWNDLGFEGHDQVRYEQLSDELYALLCQAVVAGANSSIRAQKPRPPQQKAWWQLWK